MFQVVSERIDAAYIRTGQVQKLIDGSEKEDKDERFLTASLLYQFHHSSIMRQSMNISLSKQ